MWVASKNTQTIYLFSDLIIMCYDRAPWLFVNGRGAGKVGAWLWFESFHTSTFAIASLPHSHFSGYCPARVAYLGSYELPLVTYAII